MKQKLLIASILVLVAAWSSCTTKFNVAAPYKNITIVYGFMDQNDTAHYVRVEKAFLDNSKNAITMATVPDSSYFPALNVKMKLIDINGNVVDTLHLNRVDMNAEGYPKQSGTFFTSPNYAYKFTNALNPDYNYQLVITNLQTGVTDSALTSVIVDNDHTVFGVLKLDDQNPLSNANKFDFASLIQGRHFDIQGSYSPTNGMPNPVALVECVIRINWIDSNSVTNSKTPRSYDYNLGYLSLTNNAFDFAVNNADMYNTILAGMGAPGTGVYRLLDRCQLFVYVGTSDFNSYYQSSLIQGTGLTGSEIEPNFTNISGLNTVGLFTSRGSRSGYVTITNETIDSLELSNVGTICKIVNTAYH